MLWGVWECSVQAISAIRSYTVQPYFHYERGGLNFQKKHYVTLEWPQNNGLVCTTRSYVTFSRVVKANLSCMLLKH